MNNPYRSAPRPPGNPIVRVLVTDVGVTIEEPIAGSEREKLV